MDRYQLDEKHTIHSIDVRLYQHLSLLIHTIYLKESPERQINTCILTKSLLKFNLFLGWFNLYWCNQTFIIDFYNIVLREKVMNRMIDWLNSIFTWFSIEQADVESLYCSVGCRGCAIKENFIWNSFFYHCTNLMLQMGSLVDLKVEH